MATEVTEKPKTELISVDKAKALMGKLLKDEVLRFTNELLAIQEIKTDDDLELVKAKSTALNKVLKKIDDKRSAGKDPYLQAGKNWDTAAKDIVGNAPEVIKKSKQAMIDYIDKREKEVAQRERDLADKEKTANDLIQKEKVELQTKLTNLEQYCRDATKAMEDSCAQGMDGLRAAYTKWVVQDFPDLKSFGTHESVALAAQNLLKRTKDLLKDGMGRGGLSAAMKQVASNDVGSRIQEAVTKQEEVAVETATQQSLDIAVERADNTMGTIDSGAKRIKWNWKLDNFKQVPEGWKRVDEDAVEEYININKDKLEHGMVVNGIMFIAERSLRLG